MLDIKFVRENPDKVKENIKNKFQEEKLSLVDEVIALDEKKRKTGRGRNRAGCQDIKDYDDHSQYYRSQCSHREG